MTKILAIFTFLSIILLISGISCAETTENLVKNAGFEGGTGSQWWSGSPRHCFSDDEIFHSGQKSLRITVTDPKTYVLVGQAVPVIPGESYDIGAWIKAENVTSPGAHVCIEWHSNGRWLGGEWGAKTVTRTQDWQFAGLTGVQIPENATSATVYVYLIKGSTGTAWYDDVIVNGEVKPLMRSFILRPNYSGKVLPESPSPEVEVEIILHPEEQDLILDKLKMIATLKNKHTGNVVQKDLDSLSSKIFDVDLDIPASAPKGDYRLTIGLYSKTDERLLTASTHHIEKLSREDLANLTSYIDGHNRFILNGKPFFPLGLYVVQPFNETSQLIEIANSPFDTLMNYSVNDGTDTQITTYLNRLKSLNLNIIFSLWHYIGRGQEGIDAIAHKVKTFKDHPAVISWYMNDERGLEYLPQLESAYQKIREFDDNHPVWSVNWRKYVMIREAHTTDILGVDPYPIPKGPITLVSQMADWAKEAGRGYMPLWLVPQIFDWSDHGREGRPPTREEMRAMTYLAINHGAKGLIYYSYFNIRDDEDYQTRWEQIKEIAGEIDRLRPVLLSTQKTNSNDIVCKNGNIDFKLLREANTYYLLAVNIKKEIIANVSFQNTLRHKPAQVDVLFEGDRQIPITNGNFNDAFGPYEVHVYKWKKR